MVPRHKNLFAYNCWRTTLAEIAPCLHLPEIVSLPDEVAIHRVAVKATRSEMRVDVLTVCTGRSGRETVGVMRAFMRCRDDSCFLPEQLSVFSIVTKQLEIQVGNSSSALAGRNCSRNEDRILPNYG